MSVVIECSGLGKRYNIGEFEGYRSFRETLVDVVRNPWRKLSAIAKGTAEENEENRLWALRDFSLEVHAGEVLGIIGRNGAGKSTLLKILSRITKPTEGRVEMRGRVGTLLEVGAGFHPELTGRENIFLNGAVLGMTRQEIRRKFDEIVEFSECGRILDTAMKHYSSGMYVRLAFAVAAHLETEILFVDEVLAVGDAAFQKKCIGKMSDAAYDGRTVLFVSHNLLAVESLCTRAICLHGGETVLEGTPKTVVSHYLQNWMNMTTEVSYPEMAKAPGNEFIRLRSARVRAADRNVKLFTVRTALVVEFEYWKLNSTSKIDLAVEVANEHGINVFCSGKFEDVARPEGLWRASFEIPADLLNSGSYRIELDAYLGGVTPVASWDDILIFEVQDTASELRGMFHDVWPGIVRPNLVWNSVRIGELPAEELPRTR